MVEQLKEELNEASREFTIARNNGTATDEQYTKCLEISRRLSRAVDKAAEEDYIAKLDAWKAKQVLCHPQEKHCYYNWLGQKILKAGHPDYRKQEIEQEIQASAPSRHTIVITNPYRNE